MTEPNKPKVFSFTGFFQITRAQNLLVIMLAQYAAAIFLISGVGDYLSVIKSTELLAIVLSTLFIAAAGYIINDYYDVKIDLINKPEKVVVGTVLKRRTVMAAHTLFNLTGILLGLWVDFRIGIINFVSAFLLWLYSNQLKRMPFWGNFVVALLTGLSILLIGLFYSQVNIPIILYTAFAFTSNFVREIIKDIEDLAGDEKFGSQTLPIVWGVRKTKFFILIINILFSIFVLYLLGSRRFPGPEPILYFFLIAVIFLSILLIRADKKSDFKFLSVLTKWFMLLGILTMPFIEI